MADDFADNRTPALRHGRPWRPDRPPASDPLRGRQLWTSVLVLNHRVVLRTVAGGASYLALAIDQAEPPGTLGTIAGNDSVLLICDSAATAERTVDHLMGLFGPEAGPKP